MWKKDFLLHRTYLQKTSLSVLLLSPYWSPYLLSCIVFDLISSNIDEVLSINLSANVFMFGYFNVHHKDWLTYSAGTDRPGELCHISNDLTQMVNFPTWMSQSCSFGFISSDTPIASAMAFSPLGNSNHVVASVSNDFPINLRCPASSHILWLFLCWLGLSSWLFERYSMGGYL